MIEAKTPTYTEATLTPLQVNLIGVPLTFGLLLVCVAPYVLTWGWDSLAVGLEALGWWLVPVIVIGIVFHEVLHAVGWKVGGGLAWSEVKLGFQWKMLMPYAHARVPMTARAYRIGAALPGLVTGALPVLAALALGQPVVLLVGIFFFLAAVGDMMILCAIWRVPAHAQVLDHPTLPGCLVVEEAA